MHTARMYHTYLYYVHRGGGGGYVYYISAAKAVIAMAGTSPTGLTINRNQPSIASHDKMSEVTG